MQKRSFIRATAVFAAVLATGSSSFAQEAFKIGLVLPMTGPFASTGRLLEAGARLYIAQNGNAVAGRRVELIVRDDTGTPDISRRLAQELVVNDKVDVLAGFYLTPSGLAAAPVATQSRTPMVVMVAATSRVIDASPYIVRTSFTMPQVTSGIADWAPRNGIRKVVTLVTDYGPGIDAEAAFKERFTAGGGQVVDSLRVPLRSLDFAPYLQKVRDTRPDAVFVFVPAGGAGLALMKQFTERGLGEAGIKLIGTGDMLDDENINEMGDVALGIVTSHHYSAAHPSPTNRKFVEAFAKANKGLRANYMAVSAYDSMHVIYEALKATKGRDGDALVAAMKGLRFESPRGPVSIDPQTRDIVQNVYLRKVEKIQGELYNVEFGVLQDVKDPRPRN
jgi:branched-chain amino acid transport system substrate-binding protein